MKGQRTTRGGVDRVALTFLRIQPRQVRPNKGSAVDPFLTCVSALIYCTGALYTRGAQSTERHYVHYLGLFVLHVGSCCWKRSGSFLCEQCCSELGPGPARGLAERRSALAWPQSAFLSHAAPDLLTHFLTQEIELTPQPGPRDPTDTHSCPLNWPRPLRPS